MCAMNPNKYSLVKRHGTTVTMYLNTCIYLVTIFSYLIVVMPVLFIVFIVVVDWMI